MFKRRSNKPQPQENLEATVSSDHGGATTDWSLPPSGTSVSYADVFDPKATGTATQTAEATFIATYRAELNEHVNRADAANALDEGTGAVFDDLIDSWTRKEQERLNAQISEQVSRFRGEITALTVEQTQINEALATTDRSLTLLADRELDLQREREALVRETTALEEELDQFRVQRKAAGAKSKVGARNA